MMTTVLEIIMLAKVVHTTRDRDALFIGPVLVDPHTLTSYHHPLPP